MTKREITINGRRIGSGHPMYIIAELSGNHGQEYDEAVRLIHAAKDAGADAVKLQTYTADTLTIDSDEKYFQIGSGTIWEGKNLYRLYGEAYTPWEWQPKLKEIADGLGLDLFSSPFDASAVDFLEAMNVPAYKIASFEIVDLDLIRKVASTGKPMIISTGMATLPEIDDAVKAAREAGATEIALLKCNSAYPAPPEEMNLRTIPHMADSFDVPVGLSDHTMEIAVPVAAVALGACILEKHIIRSRQREGPDSAFSLEPEELKQTVNAIRVAEKALGRVQYQPTSHEAASRVFRRSLFVTRDMRAGEEFTHNNLRCIRPGYGMAPKNLHVIIGRKASSDIKRGTPLTWELVH